MQILNGYPTTSEADSTFLASDSARTGGAVNLKGIDIRHGDQPNNIPFTQLRFPGVEGVYDGNGNLVLPGSWPSPIGSRIKFTTNGLVLDGMNGGLYLSGSSIQGNLGITSDDRLKFDETPISGALNAISKLRPCKYRQIPISEDVDVRNTNEKDATIHTAGFIAQEVFAIPELSHSVIVPTQENLPYQIRYEAILAHTVAALQELSARVIELENKTT